MIDLIHPYLMQFAPVLTGVAAIYALACAILLFGQRRFIFDTSRQLESTPNDFDLPYQDVWLSVSSRRDQVEQIHGWWIPSNSGSNQPVIIHLHGNNSNIGIGDHLGHAQQFHHMGLSVLLIDYRGYGHSTPRFPSEKMLYQDVETAWNYLVDQQGINPHQIFVLGHSLGGAIAIELAVRHPEIAGLIVESSFTSMQDMAKNEGKYWMFPLNLILKQRFASIEKVHQLKMPVLFTHGTNDQMIPQYMSEALYAAATEPKQLLIVPNAEHNDVRQVGGVQYFNTVQQFIQQVCQLQHR